MEPIDNRAKEEEEENDDRVESILRYLYFVVRVHHRVILDRSEYLNKEFRLNRNERENLQYVLAIQQ